MYFVQIAKIVGKVLIQTPVLDSSLLQTAGRHLPHAAAGEWTDSSAARSSSSSRLQSPPGLRENRLRRPNWLCWRPELERNNFAHEKKKVVVSGAFSHSANPNTI